MILTTLYILLISKVQKLKNVFGSMTFFFELCEVYVQGSDGQLISPKYCGLKVL